MIMAMKLAITTKHTYLRKRVDHEDFVVVLERSGHEMLRVRLHHGLKQLAMRGNDNKP
jgi:hypothetical protein